MSDAKFDEFFFHLFIPEYLFVYSATNLFWAENLKIVNQQYCMVYGLWYWGYSYIVHDIRYDRAENEINFFSRLSWNGKEVSILAWLPLRIVWIWKKRKENIPRMNGDRLQPTANNEERAQT